MNAIQSLIGGAAGAVALNAVHQTANQRLPHAPRVDVIGRRVVAHSARALGLQPPVGQRRQNAALALDLVSNSFYYALLGMSRRENLWRNATALGLAAGVGTVALSPALGLGSKPASRTPTTAALTVAWYTIGALTAAAVLSTIAPPLKNKRIRS